MEFFRGVFHCNKVVISYINVILSVCFSIPHKIHVCRFVHHRSDYSVPSSNTFHVGACNYHSLLWLTTLCALLISYTFSVFSPVSSCLSPSFVVSTQKTYPITEVLLGLAPVPFLSDSIDCSAIDTVISICSSCLHSLRGDFFPLRQRSLPPQQCLLSPLSRVITFPPTLPCPHAEGCALVVLEEIVDFSTVVVC